MNDNPPAFPSSGIIKRIRMPLSETQVDSIVGQQEGMSLRDYFASSIMNGICSNQFYLSALLEDFKTFQNEEIKLKIAQISYEQADAMLTERKKHVKG